MRNRAIGVLLVALLCGAASVAHAQTDKDLADLKALFEERPGGGVRAGGEAV